MGEMKGFFEEQGLQRRTGRYTIKRQIGIGLGEMSHICKMRQYMQRYK